MDGIRAFRREDIAQVAALWLRVFRRQAGVPCGALQDYFREILLEAPWRDPALPSLVYEEGGLGIVGFLGVLPRTMLFEGRPIRVAVPTQLMADSRARNYPAVKLMRRFLDGPQDLSFSDGANDLAEKLWCSCGGVAAGLHNLKWTRVLRPAQHLKARLAARAGWRYAWLGEVFGPFCHAVDAAAA